MNQTLLIPRQDFWSLAPYNVFINGSFTKLWPDVVSAEDVDVSCEFVASNASLNNPFCPVIDIVGNLGGDVLMPSGLDPSVLLTVYVESNFEKSGRPYAKNVVSSMCPSAWESQYCATTLQEIFYQSMISEPPIGAYGALKTEPDDFVDTYYIIKDNYYQPYTIANCVNVGINDTTKQAPLLFAHLLQNSSELQARRARDLVPITNMTIQQALSIPGDTSQYRTTWIDLPQNTFETQVPGAIFVHPRDPANQTAIITTCTLNAGWGSSQIALHSRQDLDVYSHMAANPAGWPPETAQSMDIASVIFRGRPDFANLSGSAYPEKRLQITSEWMNFLNPMVQLFPDLNSTAISYFLPGLGKQPSEDDFARFISIWLASALARTGLAIISNSMFKNALPLSFPLSRCIMRAHNGNLPYCISANICAAALATKSSQKFCNDCVSATILHSGYGWMFLIATTGIWFAIGVMVAYCTIAVVHSFYLVISGLSSSAWDSIAELVVLAMNSKPTMVLQNTCAGIIGVRPFKSMVQILETTEGHLELCFSEELARHDSASKIQVNEEYGHLSNEKMKDE
jgi:hypothetical protein